MRWIGHGISSPVSPLQPTPRETRAATETAPPRLTPQGTHVTKVSRDPRKSTTTETRR
jgi:hypothetical protein